MALEKNCAQCGLSAVQKKTAAGIEVLAVGLEGRVHFHWLVPNPVSAVDVRQQDCQIKLQPCGHFGGTGSEFCPRGLYMEAGQAGFRDATSFETVDESWG